jgi:hypothetical protein
VMPLETGVLAQLRRRTTPCVVPPRDRWRWCLDTENLPCRRASAQPCSLVGVSEGERGASGGHGGRARVMRAMRGGGCGVSAGAPKSMGIMHIYVH